MIRESVHKHLSQGISVNLFLIKEMCVYSEISWNYVIITCPRGEQKLVWKGINNCYVNSVLFYYHYDYK